MSAQPLLKDPDGAEFDSAPSGMRLVQAARASRPGTTADREASLSERARTIAAALPERRLSLAIIGGIVRAVELAAIVAIGVAAFLAYVPDPEATLSSYAAVTVVGAVLTLAYGQALDGYALGAGRHFVATLARILVAWAGVLATLTLFAFFLKIGEAYSRIWMLIWFGTTAVFFIAERIVLASLLRRWSTSHQLERRAVIVGGGQAAGDLIAALEAEKNSDIRICGVFDDRSDDRSPPIVGGYPKLGTVAELVEFGRMTQLDMLIVTLPITAERRVLELLKKLWVLPVDIRLSTHANKLKFRPRSYSYVGTVPFLDVIDKPLADWDRVAKRTFDLVFGTLALLALSPVIIATAIAIKLDSRGPVFFRQKRYGFNNELIDVWKFRSMYVDQADQAAARLVTKGDPRVTRVGRFIRKASIDELPQLFNVLAGSLSLVGPRPHALAAKAEDRLYEQVVDSYFARHRVKPGVTGWAQINGWRGETDTSDKIQRRVECDLYYIENWSLSLDLYILFATPFRLLDTENAY